MGLRVGPPAELRTRRLRPQSTQSNKTKICLELESDLPLYLLIWRPLAARRNMRAHLNARPDEGACPRWRGGAWRCTFRAARRRAVLSEVRALWQCVFWFRHAAPRNQHPRNRVSSRRLRETDRRLAGSCLGSAANSTGPPSKFPSGHDGAAPRGARFC